MYKVIYKFADLQDHKHVYDVGDTYPREGSKPSQERIDKLANGMNKIGRPLIEEVHSKKPVPTMNEEIMNEPAEVAEPTEKPKKSRKKKAE